MGADLAHGHAQDCLITATIQQRAFPTCLLNLPLPNCCRPKPVILHLAATCYRSFLSQLVITLTPVVPALFFFFDVHILMGYV